MKAARETLTRNCAARVAREPIRVSEPLDRKQAALLVLFEAIDLIDDPAASELVRFAAARLVCGNA